MTIFWTFENEDNDDCALNEQERDALIEAYELDEKPYSMKKIIED